MALIKCPECGKDVENNISLCPHCGFRLKKSNIPLLVVNITLSLFTIGLLFFLVFSKIQTSRDKSISNKLTAIQFIEELPSDCEIIETIMDSTLNKIFYYKNTTQGVEFRCFDVSNSTDNIITTRDIYNVSNYCYDKKNNCIFVIVKTTNEKPSFRYSLYYINVDDCKVDLIANGIAIYFINKSTIKIEKAIGRDVEIDLSIGLNEIMRYKDEYIKDENNWDL